MKNLMHFNAADIIASQGCSFRGEIKDPDPYSKELNSPDALAIASLRAQFDISVGNADFLLLGEITGRFKLRCSRCLAEFHYPFDQELEATFPKTEKNLDVGEEIRQALILAVPAKPVCCQGCKGLCPQCGMNLNESQCSCQTPRSNPFAKLKRISDA